MIGFALIALRVVSLAPNITEMVLFLGGKPHLVGVTVHDTFQAVKDVPRIGGFADPSYETLVRLHPDRVLLTDTQKPLFEEALSRLGLPVMVVHTETVDELLASMDTLAQLLGNPKAAQRVARIRDMLETVTPLPDSPTVLIVVSRHPGSLEGLYVAGRNTFYHDLLSRRGLVNAVDRKGYVPMDLEHALSLHPRWIVDITGDVRPDIYVRFRPDRVIFLPPDPYLRPGVCAIWHFVNQWEKDLSKSTLCPPSAATNP